MQGQERLQNPQDDQLSVSGTKQHDVVDPHPSDWNMDERTDLDVLAAATHTARDSTAVTYNNGQQDTDTNTWRYLFAASDSTVDNYLLLTDIPFDSEWREIYWQQPDISGSFGDGMWSRP